MQLSPVAYLETLHVEAGTRTLTDLQPSSLRTSVRAQQVLDLFVVDLQHTEGNLKITKLQEYWFIQNGPVRVPRSYLTGQRRA